MVFLNFLPEIHGQIIEDYFILILTRLSISYILKMTKWSGDNQTSIRGFIKLAHIYKVKYPCNLNPRDYREFEKRVF